MTEPLLCKINKSAGIVLKLFNLNTCKRLVIIILLISFWGCSDSKADKVKSGVKEAEELWMKGKYRDAEDKYLNLIDKYPGSESYLYILFRLGELCHLNLYDDKRALLYFKSIINYDEESSYKYWSHKYLADIYENSLFDYEKAIVEYQRLIDDKNIAENKDKYQLNISSCYYKKGNYTQAILELDKFLSEYPKSELRDYIILFRSNIYIILKDYTKAEEGYKTIIADFPKGTYAIEAKLGLAEISEETGNLQKGYDLLRELEPIYPNKKLIGEKIAAIQKRMSNKP